MKTVISASRRTDIPAFYLKWFMNKIREGHLDVRNPFNHNMIRRINLKPDKVEWIVFWSRDFSTFLKNREFFNAYRLFFHFTIVTHHPLLEKKHPHQQSTLHQMASLIEDYGTDQIIWRYDPVVIWTKKDRIYSNYNRENFKFLCEHFSGLGINKCYFSYVTNYAKFRTRFQQKYPFLQLDEKLQSQFRLILREMSQIALANDIVLYSCSNDEWLSSGIKKGRCISGSFLNQLSGEKVVSEAKAPSRKDCGCTKSVDIGNYLSHPCYFGCIYCYANPVWR